MFVTFTTKCLILIILLSDAFRLKKWLINNGGIFNAIETIKDYENDNFGIVTTDLSEPERVCNMYTYILGEQVLNELETIKNNWDDRLNDELKEALLDELS